MSVVAAVDWTQVLVYGLPAYLAAVFAGVAGIIGALNRRNLRTPSGESIGSQVEQTHHLTSAHTALLIGLKPNGGRKKKSPKKPPAKEPT